MTPYVNGIVASLIVVGTLSVVACQAANGRVPTATRAYEPVLPRPTPTPTPTLFPDQYLLLDHSTSGPEVRAVDLLTMKEWKGEEDATVTFKADRSPWLLYWETSPVSQLATRFEILIDTDRVRRDWGRLAELAEGWPVSSAAAETGENYAVFHDQGSVTLRVEASGVRWKVMVAREP